MDQKLRDHLLDESRTMLAEAQKALDAGLETLMHSIHDVDEGDYHPLRKEFHRKALAERVRQEAQAYVKTGNSSSQKRNLEESRAEDVLSGTLSQVNLADTRDRASVMSDTVSGNVEQEHKAELARIEAKMALEQEQLELLRVESEKAEIVRVNAERAEKERLAAEAALEEERRMLAQLMEEKELLRKKIEQEKQELERIEKEKERVKETERKETEERLSRDRLEREQEERNVLEAKRISKEKQDEAEKERLVKELADLEERNRKSEQERLDRIAKEEAERNERIAKEEAERKARIEQEEQERREKFAKEEAEQQERLRAAHEEHEEKLRALAEAARLEREAEEAERQARAGMESLEKEHAKQFEEEKTAASPVEEENDEERALKAALAEREILERNTEENDEERALRDALAEREILEQSMATEADSSHMQGVPQESEEEDESSPRKTAREEEEHHETQQPVPPSALETSFESPRTAAASGAERKYVTIQDRMLQPRKKGLFFKAPRERVLVLREDKFRYFDENKAQMLGGLSLAEEGVEVVLAALKKSPSGVALRFSSPSVGTLEFYPATVEVGKKWISAIEHNMEMRYELPDLGPEEAHTYYDYLGVPPDHADPATLLQAYADRSRTAQDEWLRTKLNEALQVLHDPFRKVEYDNFVMVQRKYRFGSPATVQIRTPRGDATDPVSSRVFTDASFAFLYWQDVRLGPSLTGRHLCVELARIQEIQPGNSSNTVQLLLNNGEILLFGFEDKRETEDFGAAIRFAKSPQLSLAKRRQSVQETSV